MMLSVVETEPPKRQPVTKVEDVVLLRRHVDGDATAFSILVGRYQNLIYGFLTRSGVTAATRDDLFQEVFFKVHRAAPRFKPTSGVRPWIFTIATNVVRDHYRKTKVRRIVISDEDAVSRLEDERPDSEAMVRAHQTAEWIESAIQKLPQEQREVLALACFAQMKLTLVAETLELPLGTVKTRLRRARIALAEALEARK